MPYTLVKPVGFLLSIQHSVHLCWFSHYLLVTFLMECTFRNGGGLLSCDSSPSHTTWNVVCTRWVSSELVPQNFASVLPATSFLCSSLLFMYFSHSLHFINCYLKATKGNLMYCCRFLCTACTFFHYLADRYCTWDLLETRKLSL